MGEVSGVIAKIQNITWYRASTLKFTVAFWQDADHTVPIDKTGSIFTLNVIVGTNRSYVKLSFTMGDGITLRDGTINVFDFFQTDEQMQIDAGTYNYDLKEELANGDVKYELRGAFIVIDNRTS